MLKRKQFAIAVFGMELPAISSSSYNKLSELFLFI